jgi:hypothetical protein
MILRIDVYGAALLRIALGCVVLLDLADRLFFNAGATDLVSFEQLREWGLVNEHWLTVHTSLGVYVVHGVACVALTLGVASNVACAIVWVLSLSLQARNSTVGYGADVLLLQVLMIACFLPLGSVWSVDAWRRGPPQSLYASRAATLAFVAQLAMMYSFSASHKLVFAGDWWTDATALSSALRLRYFASPLLAPSLLKLQPLLAQATRASLIWEAGGWLMLLVPHEAARALFVLTNLLFHLGIGFTLDVGLFAHVCIAATLAFTPWQLLFADCPVRVDAATTRRSSSMLAAFAQGLLLSVVSLSFLINVREVPFLSRTFAPATDLLKVQPQLEVVANILQLKQYWSMFDRVPRQNVQHIVTGTVLGMRVELFPLTGNMGQDPGRLGAADFTHASMHERLGGQRWLKFFEHTHTEHGRRFELIEAFLKWACLRFPQANLLTFEVAKQSTDDLADVSQQRLFRNHVCA